MSGQFRTNSRSLFREACLAGTAAVMDMERVIMTAFLQNPKLKRYAVCYANQLEESLVTDIYDVEMHEIYTETEVIRKGV